MLRSLTDGAIAGTGTIEDIYGNLGGILITADGTNAATVIIRNDNSTGDIIFDIASKQPLWIKCNIECNNDIYYSISGTGGEAQINERVV